LILRIQERDAQQLDAERVSVRNTGIRISLFSIFTIILVFLLYGYLVRPENLVFSSKLIQLISDLGMAVLVLLVGGLFAIGYGIYRICTSERMKITEPILTNNNARKRRFSRVVACLPIIVSIISQAKYFRLFVVTSVAYAVLFCLISQIIIFRPDVSFSHIYGVSIPSWKITPCCNSPGFVPMFTAYLSDNLIIFIIPINLVLVVVLSTLVGVNISLATYSFLHKNNKINKNSNNSNIPYSGGIGGAATGFFTACPTCAGTFFSTVVAMITGASSASAAAAAVTATTLGPFQTLFVTVSICILLISPYLTIKNLKI